MKALQLSKSLAVPTVLAVSVAVAGCSEDPVAPGQGPGEQELITQVTMNLTPTGGGATQSSVINDPDGLGPTPPSSPTATFQLAPGTTYNGTITFEDASDPSDVENITEEVEEEAEEHRVFYTVTGGTGVTVPDASLDTDGNGAPLGLTYQVEVTAGASGTGTIRVILSHYDDEPKGDGSQPSDETDIDVTFDFAVN